MPRMRTAAGVLAEIKATDPSTEITLHFIRHLIHTNQIPVVSVGRKKLVDVDAVIAHLVKPSVEERVLGVGIRRVTV